MAITILIEDKELREALKGEIQAAFRSESRSEAKAQLEEALSVALQCAWAKVYKDLETSKWTRDQFLDRLRLDMREKIHQEIVLEVRTLVAEKFASMGGLPEVLRKMFQAEMRSIIREELKSLQGAVALLTAAGEGK